MRILQLHCDSIEYTPTKKENKMAEDLEEKSTLRLEEVVVAFVAVEAGDNSSVADEAVRQIRASMLNVGCTRLLLYPYAHLSSDLARPSAALGLLEEMEDHARAADGTLEVSRAPFGWTKSYHVKVKGHPLAESSKVIRSDSLKPPHVTSVRGPPAGSAAATSTSTATTTTTEPRARSGKKGEGEEDGNGDDDDEDKSHALERESRLKSHWRILTPDGNLVEIDEFDFAGHKKLETLAKYESEKQRHVDEPPPHVALMKRLAIADYEHASDHGNMRFFPNGRLIKSLIESHVTNRVKEYGGFEVETPIMYDSEHPSMVSYFNRFPARQYTIDSEGKRLFLRFAACFGQFLMANQFQMSHHNLPYRLYEMTRYSFRREQTGELVGLRRLRAFTMPDCHAFCKDMDQAIDEIAVRFKLSQRVLSEMGIAGDDYEMAIRFTEDFYNDHRGVINRLAAAHGKPMLVEMWKERFFYFVLKWEFNYVDSMGKASALSTDQIDVENGSRYDITFVDEDNERLHPIILHNSPSGAVERIIYTLLEKAAADSKEGRRPMLPLWLSPTQVRIIPVKEEFVGLAESFASGLTTRGIRADIDDRNQSIGKRIREAEKEWAPYILVVGEQESKSGRLSVRSRETGRIKEMTSDDLLEEIKSKTEGMPAAGLNMPAHLSQRPQLMV
ncbi:MAG: threonine--tRNA ligase [Nitrosopumilaceae archaeon]|nr:threonine--tRNA ligase [Nitrosopumilaceae archaeon]